MIKPASWVRRTVFRRDDRRIERLEAACKPVKPWKVFAAKELPSITKRAGQHGGNTRMVMALADRLLPKTT